MKSILIQGDNLDGLYYLLNEKNLKGKIDLVYIDPPFATGGNFTITDGRATTISNSKNGNIAYTDTLKGKEFIEFLKVRLFLLKELLSKQGSIYLHIDYKIGHYVKVMMDEVFGIESFRNDITRIKCNPKNFDRIGYGNIKDLILFYNKILKSHLETNRAKNIRKRILKSYFRKQISKDANIQLFQYMRLEKPKTENQIKRLKGILPPKGRHWRVDVETLNQWDKEGLIEWSSTGNPRKIIYADEREGKRVQDIWEYKDPQYPTYPTEKNPDLLDLIIKTSSNENSIVLDCFCGSGTTLKSAHTNNRKWIGIDQSNHAIKATKEKLDAIEGDLFVKKPDYEFVVLTEKKAESLHGFFVPLNPV
jgi:adenine-specific DNA-methyltransferase